MTARRVGALALTLTMLTGLGAATTSQEVQAAEKQRSGRTTLLFADFESVPSGSMSPRTFAKQLRGGGSAAGFDDSSVVRTKGRAGKVYRVRLEKGTIRGNPSGNHGVVGFSPLRRPVTDACIKYRVRFSKGFHFSLGGKLPGLGGVRPGVSPSVPTGGGNPGSNGWSGRMMWVGPKAYSWAGRSNMAVSYMYGPRQSSAYGDNIRWDRGFRAGTWHRVKQCYRMNTVGRADGVLRAWMDGRRVVDKRNVVYRTRSDVAISHLMWAVFRGGGTLDWAGSRNGHVDFDKVRITTSR